MKLISLRLLLVIPLLLFEGCVFAPPLYLAQNIRSQVIDEETGKPLEKVIVVAIWKVIQVGFGDGGSARRVRIVETVTDKDGYFTVPSSFILRPPLTYLDNSDPDLYLFKKNYFPTAYGNEEKRNAPVRFSEWDGKQIKLGRPNDLTLEHEAFVFGNFFGGIDDISNDQDWRNYPRMLLAIYTEKQRLKDRGLKPGYLASVPEIKHFSLDDQQFLTRLQHEL